MLHSAVKKSKTAQQQGQSKPLAKQIFSSSPPTQDPRSTAAPFARVGSNGGQPLKSTSPSKVNGLGQSDKPLKRSFSSVSTTSLGSAASRSFSSQHKHQTMATATSSKNPSLHKLHQDISFDENDFCDDADINLDDPVQDQYPLDPAKQSVTYPSLPSFVPVYPQQEPEYPSLPEIPVKTPTGKQSQSSAPFPWSSSSPLAQVKPMDLHQFRRPSQPRSAAAPRPAINAKPVEVIDLEAGEPERPAKRRTLPWLKHPAESQSNTHSTGSTRLKRPKQESSELEHQTPAPKKADVYIWNQTASAVKAEQKKHRAEAGAQPGGKTKARTLESDDLLTLRKAKTTKKEIAPVFLSEEQQKVLKLVIEDKQSVFFTGSAGTGKSVLMREIIAKLRQKYKNEPDRVAVTASTGLAACNIGGNTLHSFSGIGLGKESHEELTRKIRRNQKTVQRWQRTKVLIIDEVSMIDAALLDKLETIARNLRRNARPFGGIQLVITGDFFQLPPVTQDGAPRFAFDALAWKTTLNATIGLTHVFRQKDPAFATMLNEMRVGNLSSTTINEFRKLARPLQNAEGTVDVEATELFPTRLEVDRSNKTRLDRLAGNPVEFDAVDAGTIQDKQQREKLLANCMAPQKILLRKGAQVMLIKNIDDSLVNGSIGKVVSFMDERTFDYYDENEEEFLSTQPSLDADRPEGQKASRLQGYANQGAGNTSQKWPVVRFQIPDGTSRDLLCQRETWKIEQPNGEVLASRSQIPLILAWSLSIHKAQGQTLEKVKVDLTKIFEKGQAYVALSRATTKEGLQVKGFHVSKIQAHPKVREFYDKLYSVDSMMPAAQKASKTGRAKTEIIEDDFADLGEDDLMALANGV